MAARDWFNVGALTAPVAVLFGFGFGLFAGPAMNPASEYCWIAGAFLLAGLTWWSTAQAARSARLSLEHDQEIAQQLNEGNERTETQSHKLDELHDAVEKQLSKLDLYDPRFGLVAKTITLVRDLKRFSQQIPSPRRTNKAILAFLNFNPSEEENKMILRQYQSQFGARIEELVKELRRAGIQLRQKDEWYVRPFYFMLTSSIDSIVQELEEAALTLAG